MAKSNGENKTTARDKVLALKRELQSAFREREPVIDGLLAAALAGEHIALLGPPGTAKSAVARAFAGAVGGRYFEHLMTRYTEPNEVFGPIDLQAWSQTGAYGRRTAGHFPEAEVVFLDEIFKANSSILNALLSAINERVFHDEGQPKPIPLRTVIGASNELPEGEELEALFDRFLLRFEVGYVYDRASFGAIVGGKLGVVTSSLSLAELDAIQREVAAVGVPDSAIDALFALRAALSQQGFVVSDRRWRKLVSILQATAWLAGDSEIDAIHFEVLQHGLWREPKDRAKIAAIVAKTASPALAEALEVHDAIMEQVLGLPADGEVGSQGRAVIAEVKKAVKRLDEMKAACSGAVAGRIDEMSTRLREAHKTLTERVMREMNLSI